MYVFKNSLATSEFSVLACYPAAPSKRIKVLQYRCGNPSWMFHCSSKLLSRTFHTSWTSDAWEAVHKLFLSSRSAQKHPEFTTIWSPAHMLRWWHAKDRHGPTYNADQWPSSGKSLVLLQETTESFQLRHLSLNFNCDCKCWAIFQANEGICGAGSLFNAVYIITSALPHVGQDITKKICCTLYLILEFMCIHVLAMQVVAPRLLI